MSIADVYESGEQKQNKSHLESLIAIAHVDGNLAETEKTLLEKFARRLSIDSTVFQAMLSGEKRYAINPPIDKMDRYKRLYDLVKISLADSILDDKEVRLLEKYAIGLGYQEEQANDLINKSIKFISNDVDFEEAFEQI